jgi:preprotein translocase subunit SecE
MLTAIIAQTNEVAAESLSGATDALRWVQSHVGVVGWLVALTVLAYLGWANKSTVRRFCGEVTTELRKCSWPWDPTQSGLRRYKELIDSSVVVLVSMVLLGAYTSVVDFFLVKATAWVIQWSF